MTAQLPDDVVSYLREKNVPDLMEYLLQELVLRQPESPIAFLRELLSKPITPKILIAGPPAGGKGNHRRWRVVLLLIVGKYGRYVQFWGEWRSIRISRRRIVSTTTGGTARRTIRSWCVRFPRVAAGRHLYGPGLLPKALRLKNRPHFFD